MVHLTHTPIEQLLEEDQASSRRRQGTFWTFLAAVEVLLAAVAVVLDLLIPTIVILALAGLSLALRREGLATLGFRRTPHPGRMAVTVLGLVVGWQLLTFGVIKPILNHLAGTTEDLSQFADLQGNLALLAGLLLVTWTLAAFGEELVYRGFILTRITDVLGPNLVGVVVAVGVSSILFGLAHSEHGTVGVVVTFLDALFFSVLRLRYRTLWAPILAHGFSNTLGSSPSSSSDRSTDSGSPSAKPFVATKRLFATHVLVKAPRRPLQPPVYIVFAGDLVASRAVARRGWSPRPGWGATGGRSSGRCPG